MTTSPQNSEIEDLQKEVRELRTELTVYRALNKAHFRWLGFVALLVASLFGVTTYLGIPKEVRETLKTEGISKAIAEIHSARDEASNIVMSLREKVAPPPQTRVHLNNGTTAFEGIVGRVGGVLVLIRVESVNATDNFDRRYWLVVFKNESTSGGHVDAIAKDTVTNPNIKFKEPEWKVDDTGHLNLKNDSFPQGAFVADYVILSEVGGLQ
jgi:hypothetical protein